MLPVRENVDGNRTTTMGRPHSPWHSPVPYLFGGLAAMLGLIAFALLILACSYWRLSGYLERDEDQSRDRDLEAGDEKIDKASAKTVPLPEKFLVIMAGDVKPTYLATPAVITCTCDDDDDDDEDDRDGDDDKNDVKGSDQKVKRSSENKSTTQ